jgi:GNAT superfamily N-acetyltransferase
MPTDMVFQSEHFVVRNLAPADLPELQALFEQNPDYFMTVNARLPFADEAEAEFHEMPPAHLPHGQRWFAGVYDGTGTLQGVLHWVSDLIAPSVWHVALFFLATPLHGTGAAREIYGALESWMQRSGAVWIRLGVVAGNGRAERFWDRMGYVQTRVRAAVDTGGRINDVRMLLKPLRGGSIAQYLKLVPRDAPDSELP